MVQLGRAPMAWKSRSRVVAQFEGTQISTEGGSLLSRQTDRQIRLLERAAACFTDGRNPARVEHPLPETLGQRIYGLALGYEDLNDHEQLRRARRWHC